MATRRKLKLGFTALTFLILILPILAAKEDACRPSCHGSSVSYNFQYREGTTYKYNFHSVIEIAVANAEGQKSKTQVKAVVLLTPQPHCNHLLRVQNLEVIGANLQKYNQFNGIEKSIQFHFEDGAIGDHICAETDETYNSLNIKRAITSLFQVDTKHEHETDVFGVCPTMGNVEKKPNGNILVTKIRDLNKCAFRESIKEDFMISSFNPNSEFKSTPILDGEYMSQQTIKNGMLQHVAVYENYTYLAFTDVEDDNEENVGAKIKVATMLDYVDTTRDSISQSKATESKSIIFDNPHPITSDKSTIDSILRAIQEYMQDSDMVIHENSARHFLNLVKILRDSTKDDILTVYQQVKVGANFRNKDKARHIFLDALFRCGTGNAIVVGVELLKNRELTPLEEKLVYLGFAFVKHATLSAVEAASSLLDTHNLPREAYLGIGNLAGRYCHDHSCRAEAVDRLTQRLAGKLRYGKVHTREEENETIFILKALGNIQHLNENIVAKVSAIVQDTNSPTRLRVAALETYLTDACHDSIRTSTLNVLKDVNEDSELRIKAYLVLAKCPDKNVAEAIKTLLKDEPSYQVGGFIVSHLRNLQASANPDRKATKYFLDGISTNKKFPIDPRKYSFNGEFSYDIGNLGISNSIESNVIYSSNSFLPRSTSLNLTAELFGHTINFLEIGLRQQNLDRLVEHYFGPLGVFNRATPDEVAKTGENAVQKIVNHFNERFQRARGKRDVSKSEVDDFNKRVEIKTNELNNELDIDLSVKLFGSELFFLSLSDDTENLSPDDIIDRFFDNYEQELSKRRSFNEDFQTNSLFIDSQLSYPTSLGFPLRINIEGTSSVQVKARGNLDIQKLLSGDLNAGIFKLSLVPSANVEISSSITLDAQVIEGGLKLVSNLYTATGGDLELDLQDLEKGMEMKFSLPLKKQTIISAKHEAVFNTRELGHSEIIQPLKFGGQNKDFAVCFNNLSPYIGLNYCVDMKIPAVAENGYLAGNYKFELGIENEDFSHFHYKEAYYRQPGIGGEISAEVIGARQNKKMMVKLEAFYTPESYIKASFITPIKTASIEGRLTNTDAERSLSYEITEDNEKSTGKVGFSLSGHPQRQRYTPILECTYQKLPLHVEGAFVIESRGQGFKVIFENLQLTIPEIAGRPLRYNLNGNLGRYMYDYSSDLSLSDGMATYGLNGKLHLQKHIVKLDGQLTNSYNPDSNLHIICDFKQHPTEIDSALQIIHGRDPNSQQNRFSISETLVYKRRNDNDYEMRGKSKISYPVINLNAFIELARTPKSIFYDSEIRYNKYLLGAEMDFKYSQKIKGDYELGLELYDEDDEIKFKAVRDIQGEKNIVRNTLLINEAKYDLSGTVIIRVKPNDVVYSADLTFASPQLTEPLRIHEELVSKRDQHNAVLKITDSRQEYVDFSGAFTPDNSNVKFKVNLQDVIINGHTTESRGAGNGELTIELVPQRQTIKAHTTFTIHDPTYNVRLTVYPNFKGNQGNYYTITTNNQIHKNSINSKNTIDINGDKLQLNGAYSNEKHPTYGKLSTEVDITFSGGDYGAVKYNYDYKIHDDNLSSEQSLGIEGRGLFNWRSAKINLKEVLKNVDLDEDFYDYTYILAIDGDGKKLNFEVTDKRVMQGEDIKEEAAIKMYNNHETDGFVARGRSLIKPRGKACDLLITYDNKRYLLNVYGEYNFGENPKPAVVKAGITFGSPSSDFPNVRLTLDASAPPLDIYSDSLELKVIGEFSVRKNIRSYSRGDIEIKTNTDAKLGGKDGKILTVVNSLNSDPITIAMNYNFGSTDDIKKLSGSLNVQYEKHKNLKSDVTIETINDKQCNIKFNLESPDSTPTRLELTLKELKDEQEYSGHAVVITNNQRYEITELVDLSNDKPKFDLEIRYPNGKSDELHFHVDTSKISQFEGEVKIILHEYNFVLEGSLDAKFHGEEDFFVKVTANCPVLNVHDLSLEIQNKPLGSDATGNLMSGQNRQQLGDRNRHGQRRHRRRIHEKQPYVNDHRLQRSRAPVYGEQLHINAQHAGKNLLFGSASYQVRDQGDKTIVEGSGTFTVGDERPRQHSYQLIQQRLPAGTGSGEGMEYSLNIKSDANVIDTKLKYTDKEFAFLTTLCETRSRSAVPCLRIQTKSKINIRHQRDFEIENTAHLDLRYLNWHEFGINGVITSKLDFFDATAEIFLDSQKKYQYKTYGDVNSFEISLTTPSRIVSLEGKKLSSVEGRSNQLKTQVDFYMNKKLQPQVKTSLTTYFYCSRQCNAELKLSDPRLNKDLAIIMTGTNVERINRGEINLILDIFNNDYNKVIIAGKYSAKRLGREGFLANLLFEVKSQGLNVDIKYEDNLSIDPHAAELKMNHIYNLHIGSASYNDLIRLHIVPSHVLIRSKLFNQDVLNIDCKYQSHSVDTTVKVIGAPPSVTHLELTNNRRLTLTTSHLDRPNEQYKLTANLFNEGVTDLKAEYYENGRPQHLLTMSLQKVGKNDLVYDYVYDEGNIEKYVIWPAKNEYAQITNELEILERTTEKDLSSQTYRVGELAKRNLPDFKPVERYYRGEVHKFEQELLNDPVLQDVLRVAKEVLEPLQKLAKDILIGINGIYESYEEEFRIQREKLWRQFEHEFKPWFGKKVNEMSTNAKATWERTQELISNVLLELNKFIGKHKEQLKQIGVFFVEALEDVIIFVADFALEIENELKDNLNKLYDELKKITILDELETRIKQALEWKPIPESYIQSFKDITNNMKDSTDSHELRRLITVLADYIEQKLRQQPVDDARAIQNILSAFYDVLGLTYKAYTSNVNEEVSISTDLLYALPKLIAIELSPVTYLLEGDWPDLQELLDSVSLDFEDWSLPEDLDAFIAQGRHIFTFDGKYITFPGACSYLLAYDAINGNFSIVGSYNNGLLTSITFADKHNIVTVRKGGHVLLNQAPAELPVQKQHRLEVSQDYESIHIWSKAGIDIVCDPQLTVCGVHISGYYHAQLRGLLGNANYELYDDFTLPSGKIVTNAGEFSNSYAINRCASVQVDDRRALQRNPVCSRLFSSYSSLRTCYNFIDPENYRMACDHGMAVGIEGTDRAIATAYVATCRTKGILIYLPNSFVKCINHEKPVRVDEKFQVTTPAGAADIVIIVDQDKANEHVFKELIQPLVSQLKAAFKQERIDDVDFHIIGYGGAYEKHPYHYAIDGKITFKGDRIPNIKFSTPLKESKRETFMEYLKRLEEEVELLTGQDMLGEAYYKALIYPFRAHAVKSIVVLNGKPCDEAHLEQLQSLSSLLLIDEQYTVNLFTPFKNVNTNNRQTADIVGFNHHSVFTFSNPTGSKERHEIESTNFCVEFALKNRGNVFLTNNFDQRHNKMQFVQISAKHIVKELVSVEQRLDCKCKTVTAYMAQNTCEVTDSSSRATEQRGKGRY